MLEAITSYNTAVYKRTDVNKIPADHKAIIDRLVGEKTLEIGPKGNLLYVAGTDLAKSNARGAISIRVYLSKGDAMMDPEGHAARRAPEFSVQDYARAHELLEQVREAGNFDDLTDKEKTFFQIGEAQIEKKVTIRGADGRLRNVTERDSKGNAIMIENPNVGMVYLSNALYSSLTGYISSVKSNLDNEELRRTPKQEKAWVEGLAIAEALKEAVKVGFIPTAPEIERDNPGIDTDDEGPDLSGE